MPPSQIATHVGDVGPIAVSVVRGRTQLTVLISRELSDDDSDAAFEVVPVPLVEVDRSIYSNREMLDESWQCLSAVKAADADTLFHVMVVLLKTVPDLTSGKVSAALPPGWNAPPKPFKATQAHPRAYKGTKDRRPAPRQLPATDIRPFLCDARALRILFGPLREHVDVVRIRLEKAGFSDVAVSAMVAELETETLRKVPWSLPVRFVTHLWPAVRECNQRDRSRMLALYSRLEAESNERLMVALVRLIGAAGIESTCTWGAIGESLSSSQRSVLIEALIETQSYSLTPTSDVTSQVIETVILAGDEELTNWLEALLSALANSGQATYVMAGLRLASQVRPEYLFGHVGSCENFPETDFEELAIHVKDPGWLVLRLWQMCGSFPRLADGIRASRWRSFSAPAVEPYFEVIRSFGYSDLPDRRLRRKWESFTDNLPTIENHILGTDPRYQLKVIQFLSEWLWWWDDPGSISSWLPRGMELLRRLADEPFSIGAEAERVVIFLIQLSDDEEWQRLLVAPDACFQALESACKRSNDARLISAGMDDLAEIQGTFFVDAFISQTKRLCRTAKLLGGLKYPIRTQLVEQCQTHPLFQIAPENMSVLELCSVVTKNLNSGIENPIPARLGSWTKGEVQLSLGQLERYKRVVTEKITLTRLSVLETEIKDWLQKGLPRRGVSKADDHALQLLGTLSDNKRGLRNFLKAHWAGNEEYLAQHPATLAWYQKHPAIPRDTWEQGIPFRAKGLTVELERDPLEVLKLGTYVGSCLSIGGAFSDSAAAALLDVNKQVLYARDHRRRVVGRQLVAISDDDRLVCFAVYPTSADVRTQLLFRDYDYAFARALGIPVYKRANDDDDYDIGSVLSVYWWDDFSWDLKPAEPEK